LVTDIKVAQDDIGGTAAAAATVRAVVYASLNFQLSAAAAASSANTDSGN
jgi:hypothetical protein